MVYKTAMLFNSLTLAFLPAALLLTITPGADTMLVIRSVLIRGPKRSLLTALGVNSGVIVHGCLSGLGLSLILVNSAAAYQTVKILGACYLVWLGLLSWKRFFGKDAPLAGRPDCLEKPARKKDTAWTAFSEGFLTNLLNPKVAVFYLAFLPQFIGPGDPILAKSILLAAIHNVMGFIWFSAIALGLGRMGALIARPGFRRVLEAISGTVLIGFGVKLVLTD